MTSAPLNATDQIADLKGGAGRAAGRHEGSTGSAERKPPAREDAFAAKLRGKLRRSGDGVVAEKPAAQGKKAGEAEGQARAGKASATGDVKTRDEPECDELDAMCGGKADGTDTAPAVVTSGATDAGETQPLSEVEAAQADAARNEVATRAADATPGESDAALVAGECVRGDKAASGEVVTVSGDNAPANLPITIAVVNRQLLQADPRLLAKGLGAMRIATAANAGAQPQSGVRGTGGGPGAGAANARGDLADADDVLRQPAGQARQAWVQGAAVAAEGASAGEVSNQQARAAGGRDSEASEPREMVPVGSAQGGQTGTHLASESVVPAGGGAALRAEAADGGGLPKGQAAPSEGLTGSARGQARLRLRAETQPSGRAGQGPPDFTLVEAQVSRGMAAVLAQRGGTVALRLQPAALGELRVQLDWEKGSVSVRFVAASEKARGLLEQSLPGLRASLEARGLEVVRVAVESPSAQTADAAKHGAPQPENALVARDHAGGGQGGMGGDRPWSEQSGTARSAANDLIDALGPEAGAASMVEGLGPEAVWAEPGGHARLVRLRVDALA